MGRFKNALFVAPKETAGDPSIARALDWAERNDAALTVVQVLKDLPFFRQYSHLLDGRLTSAEPGVESSTEVGLGDDERRSARETMKRNVEERTENLSQRILHALRPGIRASVKVLAGIPCRAIIREVICGRHDLVMMEAEGRRDEEQTLFGTISTQLMRKCPCPVWVIKNSQDVMFRDVLAAVNLGSSDGNEEMLNENVLDVAASIARTDGGRLHVVYCWQGAPERFEGRRRSSVFVKQTQTVSDSFRGVRRRQYDGLLQRIDLNCSKITSHFLDGAPGRMIPELAERQGADLIVMGAVRQTGVAGLFKGTTAEQILCNISCSVLTVKPAAFVSPLKVG